MVHQKMLRCDHYLVPWLVEPGALRPAPGVGILEVADKLGLVDLRHAMARLVRVGSGSGYKVMRTWG